MHRISLLTFVGIIFLFSGCTTAELGMYRNNTPKFDLFDYFQGQTRGWGMVKNWKGNMTRQFTVDILGEKSDDDTIVLTEDFDWSDGEQSQRIWTITKSAEGKYIGSADDVIGIAEGQSSGNVLNWKYQLNLEVDGSTYKVNFDDWMYLQPDRVLINTAEISKFGIQVGEVTIVFAKNH